MPIVIKSQYRLANSNTKYDNHTEVGKSNICSQGSWDECAIGLLRTLSINWT